MLLDLHTLLGVTNRRCIMDILNQIAVQEVQLLRSTISRDNTLRRQATFRPFTVRASAGIFDV
jgi:hypothetical protein